VDIRLILASASPARLSTLRNAGLCPEVIISGVAEELVTAVTPTGLVAELATRKAEAVAARLGRDAATTTIVVGCDSMLELDGVAYGKPVDPAQAVGRWRTMRGSHGVLHTGHHVMMLRPGDDLVRTEVASTTVYFADLDDEEIQAYVRTGEPLQVAGAFTVDGLGGAYVTRIEGDCHNVVGISLPLLRTMLADVGIAWQDLWHAERPGVNEAGSGRSESPAPH
jgi:septum formation protein